MSSWVNRTVLSGSSVNANGTNSHTCTFTAAASGNFLVAVVSGATTFTTPTGWTLVQSAISAGAAYVFTKTASSGESSFSTTHNGTNQPILGVVYEFPSTSSVVGTAGFANTDGLTVTGPSCTNITGLHTRFAVRAISLTSVPTTSSASWTAPTNKDYDAYTSDANGIGMTIAYNDDCYGSAFTPSSTVSTAGGTAATNTQDITFAISSADAAPTPLFIESKSTSSGGSSDTTASVTLDHDVAVGDMLIVALSYASTTETATVSDQLGNTYQKASGPLTNASLGFRDYIFYTVSQFSGTNGVTATITGSVTFRRILLHKYWNIDSLDGVNGGTGTTGLLDSGTVTTNHPTELIFGWGVGNNGTTVAGSGFTLRATAGSESTEDKIVTSTGSYNATYPDEGAPWLCTVAAFYSSYTRPTGFSTTISWFRAS